MIPGWPNGATRRGESCVTLPLGSERTRGTETSQYPEEEESTEIPLVAASERGRRPNRSPRGIGVVGPADAHVEASRSPLERGPGDGERPVGEGDEACVAVFLSSARPEKSGVKPGGPPSKAKDSRVTDSGRVP